MSIAQGSLNAMENGIIQFISVERVLVKSLLENCGNVDAWCLIEKL